MPPFFEHFTINPEGVIPYENRVDVVSLVKLLPLISGENLAKICENCRKVIFDSPWDQLKRQRDFRLSTVLQSARLEKIEDIGNFKPSPGQYQVADFGRKFFKSDAEIAILTHPVKDGVRN